jgi:hypothetical protein
MAKSLRCACSGAGPISPRLRPPIVALLELATQIFNGLAVNR